jgi:aminopeptidase N
LYEDPSDPSFIIATAHEVAHQWWYNVVGNDVFEEPWLDEALTTYSSGIYSQEAIGQEWYQGLVDFWEARYDQLLAEGEDDLVTGSLEYYEDPGRRASYGGVVYTKGALFFKDLREEIGDQAFFTALQSYYQNYQFEIATGQDLLDAFEAAAGRQLDDFYDQWLFTAP